MSDVILKVFSNADDVHLVWNHHNDIPGCLGFAIQCRRGDAEPKYLSNRVGFEDDTEADSAGERHRSRSSRIWPFQRYDWTDHAADLGDVIAYRVIARVVGDDGKLQDGPSSDWSPTLTLKADCGDGVSVHFNRGYVLSQFMAQYLKENGITLQELKDRAVIISKDVDRKARNFLGGTLRETVLAMMSEVVSKPNLELHAALYELSDEELLDGLAAIGKRAQIVLANGSVDKRGADENADARERLNAGGCVIHDRFLAPSGLAHNKFVVIGERVGADFRPKSVWTGSFNWTPTGLCTQLNNGLLIENEDLAQHFEAQFRLLERAGNGGTPELLASNNKPKCGIALGGATVDSWFSKVSQEIDIKGVNRARQRVRVRAYLSSCSNPAMSRLGSS